MCIIRPAHVRTIIVLGLALTMLTTSGIAELQNHGPDGEYFHDTASGLYWFDPGLFHGDAHVTMDLLAVHSTIWNWAASAQIDALLGQTAETGFNLEYVMGPRHSTIGMGGPRWIGFYAETDPDGWLVQSSDTPDFVTVTTTGYQGGAASLDPGAWYVSTVDPVAASAVLENIGWDGVYFHDLETEYYWFDPATFYGFTRSDVEGWLTSHTTWRWATADEIYDLLGKGSVDDGHLEGVMGARFATIGFGGARWLGFYAQSAEPDGILIEAGLAPSFHLLDTAGTQGGAESLHPGAWLISETDPTAADEASWGEIKRSFR